MLSISERKLVTVREITSIHEIDNADAIEYVKVEGWEVVTKKNEFKVGELCVYFEIDSFLPTDDSRFDFFMKNKTLFEGKDGVKIRTVKLRGQVSQGLIMELSVFPEIEKSIVGLSESEIRSLDFSEDLGVIKWEAPIPSELDGEVVGAMPTEISSTSQDRIQNLPDVLCSYAETEFEASIKLDGESMTVFRTNSNNGVCSKSWWYEEADDNALWSVAKKNNLIPALNSLGRNLALQGEIIGEGINGNKEKIKGKDFYLFRIYDIDASKILGRVERDQVINELRGRGAIINVCPIVEIIKLKVFSARVSAILDYAAGPSLNPKHRREGLVFTSLDGQVHFKVISNKYLLKHGG